MLARELVSLHESPHEVAPFSERYPGLTAEAGYQAARAPHDCGQWPARSSDRRCAGAGENVLGSPIAALEHLVGILAKQGGRPLAPGEIVTTGVITDAHPVAPGETWSTRIAGAQLAGLTIEFA